MSTWKLTIELGAEDFKSLKRVTSDVLGSIARAENHRAFPIAGGCSRGTSYHVLCETPLEQRIKDLRRNADELEEELRAGKR